MSSVLDLMSVWPDAVPSQLLCSDSEYDKQDRAEGIFSIYFQGHVRPGDKMLDFGCGEGHLVKVAAEKCKFAVGYDLAANKAADSNWLIANQFNEIREVGPFDVITAYDVFDHCDNPVDLLRDIRAVSTSQTKIIIRFHPWCGRHGGHLYQQLNKAFAHLILTESECKELGLTLSNAPVQKIYFPIAAYTKWIGNAGLKIKSQEVERHPIEPFFRQPLIEQRIMKLPYEKFPTFQLEQCFFDVVCSID